MTKKIYLETLKECARSLCFPLLAKATSRIKFMFYEIIDQWNRGEVQRFQIHL